MKQHKILKQITVYITICIFCALYLSFFDFRTNEDSWKNHMDTNYDVISSVDENGNNINIAKISTPEQLAGVMFSSNSIQAENVNTINLTANLDMQGKTWDSVALNKNFDGKGYIIKNLTISSSTYQSLGFTSEIGSNRTLKNVYFENLKVTNNCNKDINNTHVGGVAGINRGTIDNVVVLSGTITTTNLDYIGNLGGLVGYNYGVIKNSTNYANVSRGVHTGGIVGLAYSGQITNCENYGTISAGKGSWLRTGGIAGERTIASITLCTNYGTISNNNSTVNSIHSVNDSIGGIIGYDSYTGTLSENANYGNIESTTNTNESCVGGIVGYKAGGRIENSYTMKNSIVANSLTSNIKNEFYGYNGNSTYFSTGLGAGGGGNSGVRSLSKTNDNVIDNARHIQSNAFLGYSAKWSEDIFFDCRSGFFGWQNLNYESKSFYAYAGGIVGKIDNSGTVASCYSADTTISGGYTVEKLTGTTFMEYLEKQRNEAFTGWNNKTNTQNHKVETSSTKIQNYYGAIIGNFADATEVNSVKYNTSLKSFLSDDIKEETTVNSDQGAITATTTKVISFGKEYTRWDRYGYDYDDTKNVVTFDILVIPPSNTSETGAIWLRYIHFYYDWRPYEEDGRDPVVSPAPINDVFSAYYYNLGEGQKPTTPSTSYYNKTGSLTKFVRDLYLGNRMMEASSAFAVDDDGKINNGYPYLKNMYY